MSTNNAPGFVSGLKAFFENPLYSDLTLVCGDEEFKVHRMLLHEQSPVFRKMLNGGFVESVTSQKSITVLDDPPVFRAFLKYLYSSQYDDTTRGDMTPPEFAISMYAIAYKYDFEPLRKAAARKLDETCDVKHNANDFIAAVYAVEANTAPNDLCLWNVVIPKIVANISLLAQSPDFMKMATIHIPDLAAVLFSKLDKANEVVFRSTTLALSPSSNAGPIKTERDQNDDGGGEDDESSGDERGNGRGGRRPGPYRGQGRRLG